jgi:hypothetical protein
MLEGVGDESTLHRAVSRNEHCNRLFVDSGAVQSLWYRLHVSTPSVDHREGEHRGSCICHLALWKSMIDNGKRGRL